MHLERAQDQSLIQDVPRRNCVRRYTGTGRSSGRADPGRSRAPCSAHGELSCDGRRRMTLAPGGHSLNEEGSGGYASCTRRTPRGTEGLNLPDANLGSGPAPAWRDRHPSPGRGRSCGLHPLPTLAVLVYSSIPMGDAVFVAEANSLGLVTQGSALSRDTGACDRGMPLASRRA